MRTGEQIILDAGVDVNIRNVHNTTPLHVALARGAASCVGLLLSAGADCNLQVSTSITKKSLPWNAFAYDFPNKVTGLWTD